MKNKLRFTAIIMSFVMFFGIVWESGITINAASESETIVEAVTFSHKAGCYENEFNLTLTADSNSKIYYTTDGSDPKVGESGTKLYSSPIKVTDLKGKNLLLSTKENAYKYCEDVVDTRSGDSFKVYVPKAEDVDRAFIVRAIAVDEAGTASKISTRTYFINNNIVEKYNGVAVISLVTDPDNLLDSKTGIYVLGEGYDWYGDFNQANFMMSGKEAERPANMEFFNGSDTADISRGVGIRIHGGYSRRNQQKSMNIYFRDTYDYGTNKLKKYELIEGLDKYANVMIRNGGNDADFTKFQDIFIQGQVAGFNAATQAVRPCMVYLNGEFWGLYNLTEKYSDNSIQYKYGVDNKNVVMYKDYEIDEGEDLDPDEKLLNDYKAFANLDMTKASNYKKFCDAVDVDSYIDYNATEVYVDNGDWWAGCTNIHNHLLWRVADPTIEDSANKYGDGKWRYCLFDTEYSMDYLNDGGNYYSYSAWDRDSYKDHLLGGGRSGDRVFASAVKNKEFANKFITRLLDLRNYSFEYHNAVNVLDNYSSLYKTLMKHHVLRWGFEDIDNSVLRMKTFLAGRSGYVLKMIENNFSLTSSDRVNLTVSHNASDGGALVVNDMNPVQGGEWNAIYYKNNTIRLKAQNLEDCKFDHWEVTNAVITDDKAAEAVVTLSKAGNAVIKAVYVDSAGNEYVPKETPEPTAVPTMVPVPTAKPTNTPRPGGGWGDWDWPWRPSSTPNPTKNPAPEATKAPTPTPTADAGVNQTTPPNAVPVATPAPGVTQDVSQDNPVATDDNANKSYTVGKGIYQINNQGGAVLISTVSKKISSFVLPASVKISGKSYKVTGIGRSAFKNCKRLKRITIKSKHIKSVGAKSFSGIHKKAVIKVPKSKLKKYKKLFKGKGKKLTIKARKK